MLHFTSKRVEQEISSRSYAKPELCAWGEYVKAITPHWYDRDPRAKQKCLRTELLIHRYYLHTLTSLFETMGIMISIIGVKIPKGYFLWFLNILLIIIIIVSEILYIYTALNSGSWHRTVLHKISICLFVLPRTQIDTQVHLRPLRIFSILYYIEMPSSCLGIDYQWPKMAHL